MMKPVALLMACLGFVLTTLTLATELGCNSLSAQSKAKLDSLVISVSFHRNELRKAQDKRESCALFIEDLTRDAQKDGLIPDSDSSVEGARAIARMLENRAKCRASFRSTPTGSHPLASHVWHCIDLISLPNKGPSINNKADDTKAELEATAEAEAKVRADEEAESESKAKTEVEAQMNMRPQTHKRENEQLKVAIQALSEQLKAKNQALDAQLNEAAKTISDRANTIEELSRELRQSESRLSSRVNANNGNVGELKNCMANLDELKKSQTQRFIEISELERKLSLHIDDCQLKGCSLRDCQTALINVQRELTERNHKRKNVRRI